MKTFQEVHELVKTLSKLDIDDLYWYTKDGEVKSCVNCNDMFAWGCADAEDIEIEDLKLLKEVHKQLEDIEVGLSAYWYFLYCARKRNIRPQGAMYKHIPKEMLNLINDCGTEREIDICNPYNQNDEYIYSED